MLVGCDFLLSEEYWSPGVQITLVDAITNKPVEGVIAVINWPISSTSYAGSGVPIGSIVLFEVVSNSDGILTIPPWGPSKVSRFVKVEQRGPVIRLFKKGYEYNRVKERFQIPSEIRKFNL